MRIGILTSSRADFGIYYPLVKLLWNDKSFDTEIIAFGTHLKKEYGYTVDEIENQGFAVQHRIQTPTNNSSSKDIANNISESIQLFAEFWSTHSFDLVIALGDRYEMFAAVTATTPFNIEIAHLHAGETTLGAIDNVYRHSISLMSKYLFVSTDYRKRAIEIIQRPQDVFKVGALSIDNLNNQEYYSKEEFKIKFNIDLNKPSILSTFHPETVSFEKNDDYINELIAAFEVLKKKYQIIITMPNSDTMGDVIREKLIEYASKDAAIKLVESFGMKGYLTCMKYAYFLMGNTSSGFVEAAFFPKWVINLGDRQNGRIITPNILNCSVLKTDILMQVELIEKSCLPSDVNIYGEGKTASRIVKLIKSKYGLE
jgi:GDP/UDP-N,N'-diacetylbacillosamine 2-epimerase (hydrolysing)